MLIDDNFFQEFRVIHKPLKVANTNAPDEWIFADPDLKIRWKHYRLNLRDAVLSVGLPIYADFRILFGDDKRFDWCRDYLLAHPLVDNMLGYNRHLGEDLNGIVWVNDPQRWLEAGFVEYPKWTLFRLEDVSFVEKLYPEIQRPSHKYWLNLDDVRLMWNIPRSRLENYIRDERLTAYELPPYLEIQMVDPGSSDFSAYDPGLLFRRTEIEKFQARNCLELGLSRDLPRLVLRALARDQWEEDPFRPGTQIGTDLAGTYETVVVPFLRHNCPTAVAVRETYEIGSIENMIRDLNPNPRDGQPQGSPKQ